MMHAAALNKYLRTFFLRIVHSTELVIHTLDLCSLQLQPQQQLFLASQSDVRELAGQLLTSS